MFRHIHKNIALYSLIGLVTLILACGSSGGGDGSGAKPLATGTFIQTAVASIKTGFGGHFSSDDVLPYYRAMHLYWARQLMESSGYINAIAFRAQGAIPSPVSCPDITIKMGHTGVRGLSGIFASNVEQGKGTLETVLANAQVVIPPVNDGDYFTIQLDKAFYYNGVDNLVIDFVRSGLCDQTISLLADNAFSDHTVSSSIPGSDAGNKNTGELHMKFTFAGGDNMLYPNVLNDLNTNRSADACPFTATDAHCNKVQLLYRASEIDGSGPITGLAMVSAGVTSAQDYIMTVRLGHSTRKDLTTTFVDNFSDTPVTVASQVAFKVPAGIPAETRAIWFPLNGSTFTYNGRDNLIVEIEVTRVSGDTSWVMWGPVGNNVRLRGDTGASTGSVDQLSPQIKLRFNGGTMDVMTAGTDLIASPFATRDHVTQFLYGAHDLGTNAHIDKVAFRLGSSSNAEDYTGFGVVLGHTTRTALSLTLADNLDDPTNVFSGTMSVPSGLKAGDWVEIPVSGFVYDPGKNLTIQITTNAGANSNVINTGALAICGAIASSIGSSTADLDSIIQSPDLRLSYTKY